MNFIEFAKMLDKDPNLLPYQQKIIEVMSTMREGNRMVINYSRLQGRSYIHGLMRQYWIDRLLKVLRLRLI